jgi:hypothetical protein
MIRMIKKRAKQQTPRPTILRTTPTVNCVRKNKKFLKLTNDGQILWLFVLKPIIICYTNALLVSRRIIDLNYEKLALVFDIPQKRVRYLNLYRTLTSSGSL